jgi:hypothetical protein
MVFLVDLGFRTRKEVQVRIKGIDTAEIYGTPKSSDEHERGQEHSAFARAWFDANAGDEDWPFIVSTDKDHGKYGWGGSDHQQDDRQCVQRGHRRRISGSGVLKRRAEVRARRPAEQTRRRCYAHSSSTNPVSES